ncbi:MFS transporter [Paenibacillus sp. 481]|uniref:MFS transporter n=1 Tax=Paenibacillus sp. 481 TaxID=2835869 RepID=UPI001E4CA88F|nr:MFS transporter [Paenibacillus sp. 481]UHA75499.1 MFS transporter [Paenibacillus sp. 481]
MKKGLLQRNRNYRKLWLAKSGSVLGDWFNQIALGQVTLTMTNSASAMGLVLLCRSLPTVIIGPFAGPLVDFFSKRTIMMVSDLLRAVFALLFIMAYLTQAPSLLYIGALCLGISGILFDPAQQTAISQLVSREDLPEANALNSTITSIMRIVGAVAGGVAAAIFSPILCFALNSVSYLWSAICIYQIKWSERSATLVHKLPYWAALKEGITEVRTNRVARSIILIGISWGLAGGGYSILIPLLGNSVYHMGGLGIGLLFAIDGVGLLIGALLVKQFIGSDHRRANLAYGVAYLTQALFFTLLTQLTTFEWGAIMLLLMRISSGVIVPLDTYLLQINTPESVRGRVFTFHYSTYGGVMQLSFAIFGFLFDSLGISAAGAIIGLTSFGCGLFWLIQFRHLNINKKNPSS